MKDLSKDDGKRLDVNNVFDINRLAENDTLEGGASLTLGNDFIITDQDKNFDVFGFRLANSVRFEENNDLPNNKQLDGKN